MKTLQKKPICLVRPRKKRKSTFLKISLPYFSSPGLQGHGWRISCHVERNTVLFSPCLLTVAITAIRAASQPWWWWGRGQEDFLLPQFAPAEDGLTFSTEDCTQTFAISCLAREQWAQTFSLFSFSPSPSLSLLPGILSTLSKTGRQATSQKVLAPSSCRGWERSMLWVSVQKNHTFDAKLGQWIFWRCLKCFKCLNVHGWIANYSSDSKFVPTALDWMNIEVTDNGFTGHGWDI